MRPKFDCHLFCHSSNDHLKQVLTGFAMLHRAGVIRLRQTIVRKTLGQCEESHLKVVVNGLRTVYYDMHDCGEILPQYLAGADLYFKRSYSEEMVEGLPGSKRIRPYGFNYPVTEYRFDRFAISRSRFFNGGDRVRQFVRGLGITRLISTHPQEISSLTGKPLPDAEPRLIFMSKVWDPSKIENQAKRSETEAINEERAALVGALRKEFGSRFFGGLAVDEYSRRHFREFLLPDETLARQGAYFEILKRHPIAVTTRGLCNSNGWKLGEYIALSKAIVSERLFYRTTGNFSAGTNYLEFRTTEECVAEAVRLFGDEGLRRRIMEANREYYLECLSPGKIVLNTLLAAQEEAAK